MNTIKTFYNKNLPTFNFEGAGKNKRCKSHQPVSIVDKIINRVGHIEKTSPIELDKKYGGATITSIVPYSDSVMISIDFDELIREQNDKTKIIKITNYSYDPRVGLAGLIKYGHKQKETALYYSLITPNEILKIKQIAKNNKKQQKFLMDSLVLARAKSIDTQYKSELNATFEHMKELESSFINVAVASYSDVQNQLVSFKELEEKVPEQQQGKIIDALIKGHNASYISYNSPQEYNILRQLEAEGIQSNKYAVIGFTATKFVGHDRTYASKWQHPVTCKSTRGISQLQELMSNKQIMYKDIIQNANSIIKQTCRVRFMKNKRFRALMAISDDIIMPLHAVLKNEEGHNVKKYLEARFGKRIHENNKVDEDPINYLGTLYAFASDYKALTNENKEIIIVNQEGTYDNMLLGAELKNPWDRVRDLTRVLSDGSYITNFMQKLAWN